MHGQPCSVNLETFSINLGILRIDHQDELMIFYPPKRQLKTPRDQNLDEKSEDVDLNLVEYRPCEQQGQRGTSVLKIVVEKSVYIAHSGRTP